MELNGGGGGIYGLKSTDEEGNQGPESEPYEHNREQLIELLDQGAQAHGWETDLWTSRRVATLIDREFETDFSRHHCSRILRELGYRPGKPRKQAAEKDPEEKQRWLDEEAEQLKKADRRRDDHLY